MMVPILSRNAGTRARTPEQQVDLIVRIMDGRHLQDVADRAKAELGSRANQLGPLDLTRNVLRAYVRRVNQAHLTPPPFVDDLSDALAMAMGDHSAKTTVELYQQAGGRPMPTPQATVASEALAYRIAAGYAGVLIGYSERSKSIYLELVKPDVLRPEYTSHDPTEPTVIRHLRQMMFRGRWVEVEEVYDLTDLDAPSYVVYASGEDVTAEVHGQTFWAMTTGGATPTARPTIGSWWQATPGTPTPPTSLSRPRYPPAFCGPTGTRASVTLATRSAMSAASVLQAWTPTAMAARRGSRAVQRRSFNGSTSTLSGPAPTGKTCPALTLASSARQSVIGR
jgi:hypothetical protein